MQSEHRQVTVHNSLAKSEITLSNPSEYCINGKTTTHYSPLWIAPLEQKTFWVPLNTSNFKIKLPLCYTPKIINIDIKKDKETIYVSRYLSPKEKRIVIEDSSGERLAIISAFMNPTKFNLATELILREWEVEGKNRLT